MSLAKNYFSYFLFTPLDNCSDFGIVRWSDSKRAESTNYKNAAMPQKRDEQQWHTK